MIRAIFCCAVVASSAGCFHHQTYLPGVIDMRTDGSGLPSATAPATIDSKVARSGAEAFAQGAGVAQVGGDVVTVEDRHYWVFGSIPIYNESPTPELLAARDLGGALNRVEVGESMGVIDIVASIVVPLVIPATGWVLPSHTFHASGRAAVYRTTKPPVDAQLGASREPG